MVKISLVITVNVNTALMKWEYSAMLADKEDTGVFAQLQKYNKIRERDWVGILPLRPAKGCPRSCSSWHEYCG